MTGPGRRAGRTGLVAGAGALPAALAAALPERPFVAVPEGFAPYQPACGHDDLSRCSRAEVVNAFDNALRHTDALLAAAWQQLRAAQAELDSALLFLPDFVVAREVDRFLMGRTSLP